MLLALLVFFSHLQWLLLPREVSVQVGKLGLGGVAVMVFFVLSGYIISEAVETYYPRRPAFFLANRFLRLFPPYLGAFFLSYVIHLALARTGLLSKALSFEGYGDVPADIFSFGTIVYSLAAVIPIVIANVKMALETAAIPFNTYPFVRYSWTLNVEFVFYFFMFGILLLASRLKHYQKEVFVVSACAILCEHLISEYIFERHTARQFTPYFLLGVVLYHREKFTRWSWMLAVGALVMLATMHFTRLRQGMLPIGRQWAGNLYSWEILVPTLLVIGLVLLVHPLSRIRIGYEAKKIDQWCGDLSYPLYLNHYPMLLLLSAFYAGSQPWREGYWFISLVAVTLAGWGMKVLIDTPLRRMRDHFRGRRL